MNLFGGGRSRVRAELDVFELGVNVRPTESGVEMNTRSDGTPLMTHDEFVLPFFKLTFPMTLL